MDWSSIILHWTESRLILESTPNWVLVGNNGVTVSPINKLARRTLVGNSDGNAKSSTFWWSST
jgi:hypothetical protein